MVESEHIVRSSSNGLDEMIRPGEDRTDWAKVDALTGEPSEASIDREAEGEVAWSKAFIGLPPMKKQITLRLDRDIIDWFKRQDPRYQARMNAVLRQYVDAHRE